MDTLLNYTKLIYYINYLKLLIKLTVSLTRSVANCIRLCYNLEYNMLQSGIIYVTISN